MVSSRGPAREVRRKGSYQPRAGTSLVHRLRECRRQRGLQGGMRSDLGLGGSQPDGHLERTEHGIDADSVPGAIEDYRGPIGWFLKRLSGNPKPSEMYERLFSTALGGLLLRAGRSEEAIARLDEAMAVAKEMEGPGDWANLALANAFAGRPREARRWLERLRGLKEDERESFWDVQDRGVIQKEAEEVLLDLGERE